MTLQISYNEISFQEKVKTFHFLKKSDNFHYLE